MLAERLQGFAVLFFFFSWSVELVNQRVGWESIPSFYTNACFEQLYHRVANLNSPAGRFTACLMRIETNAASSKSTATDADGDEGMYGPQNRSAMCRKKF